MRQSTFGKVVSFKDLEPVVKEGTPFNPDTPELARLGQILSKKRPDFGSGIEFIWDTILAPYEPEVLVDDNGDVAAHLITVASSTGVPSETLFVAHVDTVDRSDGDRELIYDKDGMLTAREGILGADDGAGVWLLLEMIDAGVPGSYLFTEGEERGGRGAKAVATLHWDWLAQFNRAIAFDRRGTHSVITEQFMGKCCSNTAAEWMAEQLTDDAFFFAPDPSGVYTDTAEFTEIIPECTNISVGYYNEHSDAERLDVGYLFWLRDRVIQIDWESIPTLRDPHAVIEPVGFSDYGSRWETGSRDFSPRWETGNRAETPGYQDVDWYKVDPTELEYEDLAEWAYNVDMDTIIEELYDAIHRRQR